MRLDSAAGRSRVFHAMLLAVTLAGLALGVADTIHDPEVSDLAVGFERFFSYFTIWSNILLAVTCALLVRAPMRDSPGWNVVRLTALASIVITGLIYFLILRPDADLEGARRIVGNSLRHYASPVMAVAGWAAFGPWPKQPWRDVAIFMAWPLAFGGFTLLHGAITGWYPYDFVDVTERGYGPVLLQLAISGAEMLAVAAIVVGLNRRWSATRSGPP